MDHGNDSILVDIVYWNRFTENEHKFYSPRHQWYYVKDMANGEIIMFVQKDSSQKDGGGKLCYDILIPTSRHFN